MTSISSIQTGSALSKLLATLQSKQPNVTQTSNAQSPGVDSLSISPASQQALQGLGQDPSNQSLDQMLATYKPHRHHRQHGSTSNAQGKTGQDLQLAGTDSSLGSVFQAKG